MSKNTSIKTKEKDSEKDTDTARISLNDSSTTLKRMEKLSELKKKRLDAVRDNVKLSSSSHATSIPKASVATELALERKCRNYDAIII